MEKQQTLPLERIRTDGGTQMREQLDGETVVEYAQRLHEGVQFPPVVVFCDEEGILWLSDGFHRVKAHAAAGRTEIEAEVRPGTRRDAALYAAGANTRHGLRPTHADKRRAVAALLSDPEWSVWSDREIARRTGTSHPFVARLREQLSGNVSSSERTVSRGGTVYTMETEAIGAEGRRERMDAAWTTVTEFVHEGCPREGQDDCLRALADMKREGERQGEELAGLFRQTCMELRKAAMQSDREEARTGQVVEIFRGLALWLSVLWRFRDESRALLRERGCPPDLVGHTWFADRPVSNAALDAIEAQYRGLPGAVRALAEDEEWPFVAAVA